ncbi:MAG: hypothetical protein IJT08_02675 [Alphaproteobacteria bacterium]|nr:hypothetical protein [Alphaproteobacteria bacterium]
MLKLTIIRNEEKTTEEEVREVKIETENGAVTILPRHQPYLSKIQGSFAYVRGAGNTVSLAISSGFIYTDGEKCIVVIDE